MKTTWCGRGSITVEAALVVPTVIITVMVVLYIVLIIFQTCMLQVTANSVAEIAATSMVSPNKSISITNVNKSQIESAALYRRWSQGANQREIETTAKTMLQVNSILDSKDAHVEIKTNNHIIAQDITVKLDCKYNNPLGTLTAIWGLGKEIELTVWAKATVDDPVEFTRNCDFVIETASRVPAISAFQNKWQEIVNKIIDYINRYTKEK